MEAWLELVKSPSGKSLTDKLRQINRKYTPTVAELTVNSACQFQCQHCIYAPSYAKSNKNLSEHEWKEIIDRVYEDLGFRTFVFGGRGLNHTILNLIEYIKKLESTQVGFITDGPQMKKFSDRITECPADWIDISVDGMGEDHDLQRGREGAFQDTMKALDLLVTNGTIPMVSVLSCVTTINQSSLGEMMKYLNGYGIKNFCLSPVSIVGDYPNPALRLGREKFAEFVQEVRSVSTQLEDSHVVIPLYSVGYAKYLQDTTPTVWSKMRPIGHELAYEEAEGDNVLRIVYLPLSLTASREFFINSDGRIVTAGAMAYGRVDEANSFGNILQMGIHGKNVETKRADFFGGIIDQNVFEFYGRELAKEREKFQL